MRNQHSYRGPADRNSVNVYEPWEELYWGEKLGCTSQQLRAAVDTVGVKVVDIKAHLEKMRRSKAASLPHLPTRGSKPVTQPQSATFQ